MAKCELCGKGTLKGKSGMHRHGGLWARRAPVTRRGWQPNIRKVKVTIGKTTQKMSICAQCLKSRVATSM